MSQMNRRQMLVASASVVAGNGLPVVRDDPKGLPVVQMALDREDESSLVTNLVELLTLHKNVP